tara:strand:+ start:419 stop:1009 length:591 start_codon:yes stop_codon:yes gene_type:complete
MSDYREVTYTYKLVLLGDSSVGKTSIATQFVNNSFSEFQDSTIGAAFLSKMLVVNGNRINFEIWDTAGQERYHSLAPMYYRNATIILIVYDITSMTSFEGAKRWLTELKLTMTADTQVIFIGNKKDKEKRRMVKFEDVERYCYQNGLQHYEACAKNKENIDNIFKKVASNVEIDKKYIKRSNFVIEKPKKNNYCCR